MSNDKPPTSYFYDGREVTREECERLVTRNIEEAQEVPMSPELWLRLDAAWIDATWELDWGSHRALRRIAERMRAAADEIERLRPQVDSDSSRAKDEHRNQV